MIKDSLIVLEIDLVGLLIVHQLHRNGEDVGIVLDDVSADVDGTDGLIDIFRPFDPGGPFDHRL